MDNILKGACIYAQSGGPTSVINASAYGVITSALESDQITNVYCAMYGIEGVLKENLIDISKEKRNELDLLPYTPSAEFGSCRLKLPEYEEAPECYLKILEVFQKHNIRYFFYNGGNDSMDTCFKISQFFKTANYPCRIIGIPKTIDNDLSCTDHCPGYGSAAKYIATTCMEIYKDIHAYNVPSITILEVMGREAGWLAGASSLASLSGCGPDLIYLPEVSFSFEDFKKDIFSVLSRQNHAFIVVSEGISIKNKLDICEEKQQTDSFGHTQLGGISDLLKKNLKQFTDIKIRTIEANIIQRACSEISSENDINEAILVGKMAVQFALSGESGKMVSLERHNEPGYYCDATVVDLKLVANEEHCVPIEWISPKKNNVTKQFTDYVLPLIQGNPKHIYENSLPRYARLKKIKI